MRKYASEEVNEGKIVWLSEMGFTKKEKALEALEENGFDD